AAGDPGARAGRLRTLSMTPPSARAPLVVIAESVSDREEHERVLRSVPAGTPVLTVGLTCEVETALGRAQADPTRGLSRDEGFLRRAHARWAEQLPQLPTDLQLDSGTTSIDESVQRILA